MEVLRSNFQEVLPLVEKCIDESDFIAIDTEFSGVVCEKPPKMYDTLPEYYKKLKNGSSDFIILQLGLATFKYDSETDGFKNACFNFYVFPYSIPGIVSNVNFVCQSSSMTFLASTGFDFNKVFHEGIPYLSKVDEDQYRKELDEKRKKRNVTIGNDIEYQPLDLSKDDEAFVEELCTRIEEFLKNAEDDDELVLGKYNSYERRVIHNNVGMRFNGKVIFEVKSNQDLNSNLLTLIACLRGDAEKQQRKEDEKQLEEEKYLEKAIGLSYVIRRIIESGKLIVGHNMFLDILHILNQFVQKVPSDYYSFKDLVNVCFPKILDTKYMASCSPWQEKMRSSVLNKLVHVFEKPKIETEDGYKGYDISDNKCHEAAYDAFLTGVCFLAMLKYQNIEFPSADESGLEPYLNKIFVYKLADIPYMNMGGEDLKPKRDNVLYAVFPKNWKNKDLEQFFDGYGKIFIEWINDSSAYIVLRSENLTKKALKRLGKSNECKLMSYVKYEALTNAARSLPTKESLKPKLFPSFPEVPLSISRIIGCGTSPEHDSNEEVEINVGTTDKERSPPRVADLNSSNTVVSGNKKRSHSPSEEQPMETVSRKKRKKNTSVKSKKCSPKIFKKDSSQKKSARVFEENQNWD